MQEALAASDWEEAARVLAGHFYLEMPREFRLDVMRDRYFGDPVVVEIRHNSLLYRWDAETGFTKSSASANRPKELCGKISEQRGENGT